MALNITSIQAETVVNHADKIQFTLTADSAPGSGKIILCERNGKSYSDLGVLAEGSGTWIGPRCTAVFDKSVYAAASDLFCAADTGSGSNHNLSNVVRLFFDAPQILSYRIDENGELFLYSDRSKRDTLLATDMDWLSGSERVRCSLPNWHVSLALYGKRDVAELDAPLSFYHYDVAAKAAVHGPSGTVRLLVAPPVVEKVSFDGENISVAGKADSPQSLRATLYCQGQSVDHKTLTKAADNTYTWAAVLDPSGVYDVSFQAESNIGLSMPSRFFPVIAETPAVIDCAFAEGKTVLTMSRAALYAVGDKEFTGHTIVVDAIPNDVSIRFVRSGSQGPPLRYAPSKPAYYSFRNATNDVFYVYGTRPLSAGEVKINLDTATETYQGEFFDIAEKVLTVKASAFGNNAKAVRDEYAALLRKLAETDDTGTQVRALTEAVRRAMPMRAEDMLYYLYGFDPTNGVIDLSPGMRLWVEYASYQYIPDSYRGSKADGEAAYNNELNGYTGAGGAAYDVILRGDCVSFSPFLRTIIDQGGLAVPPPAPIEDDNRLCGGAGAYDLLFDGLCAPFVRLVYPKAILPRDTAGSPKYYENPCVIAASDLSPLDKAVQWMHELNSKTGSVKSAVDDVAYTAFRGRVAVIPQIALWVGGGVQWVQVGATLGDIRRGSGNVTLLRVSEAGLCCVAGADDSMPLLMGDSVVIS